MICVVLNIFNSEFTSSIEGVFALILMFGIGLLPFRKRKTKKQVYDVNPVDKTKKTSATTLVQTTKYLIPATKNTNIDINNLSSIPESIRELLWFENGPYTNYKPSPDSVVCNFGYGDVRINFADREEPSLINVLWPISKTNEIPTAMGYYPSYKNMNPDQRTKYLIWLSDITQNVDMGYVFVFYYGLERHLLFGEFDKALKAVLTLREHHKNSSFLGYSSDAIFLSAIYRKRPDVISSLGAGSFSQNVQLFESIFKGHISADLIMKSHKSFGFDNKRYISESSELFKRVIESSLEQKYGSKSFPINIDDVSKAKGVFTLAIANYSLALEMRLLSLPDISSSQRVKTEIYALLIETHETVKSQLKTLRTLEKTKRRSLQ